MNVGDCASRLSLGLPEGADLAATDLDAEGLPYTEGDYSVSLPQVICTRPYVFPRYRLVRGQPR